MTDITREIIFTSSRSGGKGGQHVNKVETMVMGSWHVAGSALFSENEKQRIIEKWISKINTEGFLQTKSQVHRSQLANKQEVIRKLNEWVKIALIKKKARIATAPTRQAKEQRHEQKKMTSEKKQQRRKFKPGGYL